MKPREFYEFFAKFGDVCSAKMPESEEGTHFGYGYINYYDSESANKAIKATDGVEIWGSKLDVKFFQKKNERYSPLALNNSSVYVKNFPKHYNENNLRELFAPFGELSFVNIVSDSNGRNFAIVSFKSDETAIQAKNALNGKPFDDELILFVDTFMNKQDRKKILATKIMESNYKLNSQFKFCNLHIRNIPYHAKDEDLEQAFKKFGEVKSAKIQIMLVTKENGEFKEFPTSRGFGYVCFEIRNLQD